MALEDSLELHVILKQITEHCSFSLGIEKIQHTKVCYDPLIIRRDNAQSKEALRSVVQYGPLPFAGITDIHELLQKAKKGSVLTEQDFLAEMRFISGIKAIKNYAAEAVEVKFDALKELFSSLVVHEHTLRLLENCFNEYGEVKDSASSELRGIRAALRRADGEIAEAAQKFLASHANSVVDSIVTYRGGRAVVLIKAGEKNTFGGMVYGDSASGQASYVEPASFVGPNNRKEHLLNKEQEEIHKILVKCSHEVRSIAYEELANLETAAILDAVFAKAEWGAQRDACAASLSDEKHLEIVKARHPLIDPVKVVSNDYYLADPNRILLITGPNTGGKTVSMKVIGLFVLMTYCGIPVTCDHCTIPFFDRVFADIGDDQSVVSSLSSFSAHMVKQAEICREATSDSLVLLDEVGSGTDPSEGESLAIAILNDLRDKKCMTVATTHYNRLKAYGKRHKDILLASVQFDMEKLAPTYKYLEGLTGQSNAFEVAEKYGLPKGIVNYARFLKSQAKTQEDELIEKLEKQLNENVLRQQKLEELIAENQKEKAELDRQLKRLEHDKDVIHAKAEEEARTYVEEAQAKADAILKDLRNHQKTAKYHEALHKKQGLGKLTEKQMEAEPVHTDYAVHDAVELRASGQVCEIIRIEKKDITILLNGREMRVKKSQIRPSSRIIPKLKEEPVVSISRSNIFASMPTECNLIGMHVDEAMDRMAGYIDEAKVNSLKSFRIIHGDGSGALRKAVHKKLSQDPSVKEFRLGTPGEGGTGATVVTMK